VAEEHFIFPLGTVLFPGGVLPLKIFEQRYVEMTKFCLRDSRPFGVCLIKEGHEVGTPAVPHAVGCLATIEDWEMPQVNMFHLVSRGGARFRLIETRVAQNGLMSGTIEPIAPDAPATVDSACRKVLELLIERVGAESFPTPISLDDASWVGYRLAEVLPLETAEKQVLLELTDAAERLTRLRTHLAREGLITQ
jgi:Lon protease-like protein